jgi:hypothetical protein
MEPDPDVSAGHEPMGEELAAPGSPRGREQRGLEGKQRGRREQSGKELTAPGSEELAG